jgi:hypothetical protein
MARMARPFKCREARMGIRAGQGAHRKETRDKRVCGRSAREGRLKVYSKWSII